MRHVLINSCLKGLSPADQRGMFRLRYETFHLRLGWQVNSRDGLERDEFDDVPGVRYIIAKSNQACVDACWRLLPTTGPNMLRDVFPSLLDGNDPPASPEVWELSRFAVATPRRNRADDMIGMQLGFGELSQGLMSEAAQFALQNGISRYVTVTTVAIETMVKKLGIRVRRLGSPLKIGDVLAVAVSIEIDDETLLALGLKTGCPASPSQH